MPPGEHWPYLEIFTVFQPGRRHSVAGVCWVETKISAKHPAKPKTASTAENYRVHQPPQSNMWWPLWKQTKQKNQTKALIWPPSLLQPRGQSCQKHRQRESQICTHLPWHQYLLKGGGRVYSEGTRSWTTRGKLPPQQPRGLQICREQSSRQGPQNSAHALLGSRLKALPVWKQRQVLCRTAHLALPKRLKPTAFVHFVSPNNMAVWLKWSLL